MCKGLIYFLGISMGLLSCSHQGFKKEARINEGVINVLFLHHSTGNRIFKGLYTNDNPFVENWFNEYNKTASNKINFKEKFFPKSKRFKMFGYGWRNYPYDYYNLWVKNGNKKSYKNEPTLRVLTTIWDVIILKHCYPVSIIKEDGIADVDSEVRTLQNYKLQYEALKRKFYEYPDTKFILWTGAALVEKNTDKETAQRAREFFTWVKNEWDSPDDNIHIWDFYELETEGGLYLKDNYADSPTNSHPNKVFSEKVAPLFCQRIVDVVLNDGFNTSLTGEAK